MDMTTGMIRMLMENEKPTEQEMLVDSLQMTNKQKETMQVSKFDNRSPLGKEFMVCREILKKQKRSARRKAARSKE
jgi:hypothetical protein